MISVGAGVRVMATRPADFRQGRDGLAALVEAEMGMILENGRVDLDSNTVERSIRPLALNPKNAPFIGFDEGPTTGR